MHLLGGVERLNRDLMLGTPAPSGTPPTILRPRVPPIVRCSSTMTG